MLRIPSQIDDQPFESLKVKENTLVAYRSSSYPFSNQIYFEENTLVYILEGDKIFRSDRSEFRVRKGDLLFIKKDYTLFSESTHENYQSLVFFINHSIIKRFIEQYNDLLTRSRLKDSPSWVLKMRADASFEKFIESVLLYFNSKTDYLNQFLEIKAQELLLHLLEFDKNNQFKSFLLQNFSDEKIDLDTVVNAFYLKNITIGELAKISGRSLSTFKRDFKERYQTSPAAYIRKKKMGYAYFLLKNQLKNVEETAAAVGFESVSHFIKVFNTEFGERPKSVWSKPKV